MAASIRHTPEHGSARTAAACGVFAQVIPVIALAGILSGRYGLDKVNRVRGRLMILGEVALAFVAEITALAGIDRGHATAMTLVLYFTTFLAAMTMTEASLDSILDEAAKRRRRRQRSSRSLAPLASDSIDNVPQALNASPSYGLLGWIEEP